MTKFIVTLPENQSEEKIKQMWQSVVEASDGSSSKLEHAMIDVEHGKAVCSWESPDKISLAKVFEKAGVSTQSISMAHEFIP